MIEYLPSIYEALPGFINCMGIGDIIFGNIILNGKKQNTPEINYRRKQN